MGEIIVVETGLGTELIVNIKMVINLMIIHRAVIQGAVGEAAAWIDETIGKNRCINNKAGINEVRRYKKT